MFYKKLLFLEDRTTILCFAIILCTKNLVSITINLNWVGFYAMVHITPKYAQSSYLLPYKPVLYPELNSLKVMVGKKSSLSLFYFPSVWVVIGNSKGIAQKQMEIKYLTTMAACMLNRLFGLDFHLEQVLIWGRIQNSTSGRDCCIGFINV